MLAEFIRCGECGKVLMPTHSGGVCPDGHGRIRPGVTRDVIREALSEEEATDHNKQIAAAVAALGAGDAAARPVRAGRRGAGVEHAADTGRARGLARAAAMTWPDAARRLRALGGNPSLRHGVVTDNGGQIGRAHV